MDEMELTGKIFKCKSGSAKSARKIFKCKSGSAKSARKAHVHNFPAELCIMVVLRRLSFPCSFHELVDIFGFPDNRLVDMYHTGVEYLYFQYNKLVALT